MLKAEFHYCHRGKREEQLDRFITVDSGKCTASMLADGYSCCSAQPHYVDWLCEQLVILNGSGLKSEDVCHEITQLLQVTACYPGKASVVFIVSDTNHYRYTTLGDSRIYWLNRGRRTADHSLAQLAVDRGLCPPERIRFHPNRHTLIRHAGGSANIQPDWLCLPVNKNEKLILCTDGFWSQLDDREIDLVSGLSDIRCLVDRLITPEPADNLSVVLLQSN